MSYAVNDDSITALVAVMFNASPGATNLAALRNYTSIDQLANDLVNTDLFNSQFSGLESLEEQVDHLLTNNLSLSQGTSAYNDAMSFFTQKLNAGTSPADVLIEATAYLVSGDVTPAFSEASRLLKNKIDVSKYYSVDLGKDAATLTELQSVFSNVTPDKAEIGNFAIYNEPYEDASDPLPTVMYAPENSVIFTDIERLHVSGQYGYRLSESEKDRGDSYKFIVPKDGDLTISYNIFGAKDIGTNVEGIESDIMGIRSDKGEETIQVFEGEELRISIWQGSYDSYYSDPPYEYNFDIVIA